MEPEIESYNPYLIFPRTEGLQYILTPAEISLQRRSSYSEALAVCSNENLMNETLDHLQSFVRAHTSKKNVKVQDGEAMSEPKLAPVVDFGYK